MTAQHTPGKSLEQLAKAAQMMPWDKSQADVPFSQRHAFQQAITADHYLELLESLQSIVKSLADQDDEGMIEHAEPMIRARAAIARATHKEQT